MSKKVGLSKAMKEVIEILRSGENLYKWTGYLPGYVTFEKSTKYVRPQTFNALLERGFIQSYKAQACETWYELTELGKNMQL